MAASAPPTIDKNTVYWLEDPAQVNPPVIVGDVEYRAAERLLCFYDTTRAHMLPYEFTGGSFPAGLKFTSPANQGVVMLRKLDKATFERVFRPGAGNVPAFSSDADVQKFYLKVIRSD